MEIDIIGLISACSYALDCIEAELVNIKNKHGKRVAYISVRMGQFLICQRMSCRISRSAPCCTTMPSPNIFPRNYRSILQKTWPLTLWQIPQTCIASTVNRILQKFLLKPMWPTQSYTIMSMRTAPGHFTKNGMKFLCLRALSTLPMWWISSGTAVHLKHRDGTW